MKPSIIQITIAVFNEKKMYEFYSEAFRIKFEIKKFPDFELYEGDWDGMKLLLCPAEIAKNTATQNRHQFHIEVDDIGKFFKIALEFGGSILEEVMNNNSSKTGSLSDPDGNSIVVSERPRTK